MLKENIEPGEITEIVKNFLLDNYLFGYDENDFNEDSSFLEYGVLDSMGIMELLTFIEDRFSIEILDSEVIPENMDSINSVSRMIIRKLEL